VAQVVWTETGTGPGGQVPNVAITVTYQDPPLSPLVIIKRATKDARGEHGIRALFTGRRR
jgi:hypothetical protein